MKVELSESELLWIHSGLRLLLEEDAENRSLKRVGLCEIYGMLQNFQISKKKERLTSQLNCNLLELNRLLSVLYGLKGEEVH
jgi:hypothetical protein